MYDDELQQTYVCTYHAAQSERQWLMDILGVMFVEGWITDILRKVKAGKEANVYLCAAHPVTGVEFLAAKVYRPTAFRTMRNDVLYREGREMLDDEGHVVSDKRRQRAIRKNTRFGRQTQSGSWIEHEYQNGWAQSTRPSRAGREPGRPRVRRRTSVLHPLPTVAGQPIM